MSLWSNITIISFLTLLCSSGGAKQARSPSRVGPAALGRLRWWQAPPEPAAGTSPCMDLCSQHPSLAVLLFARMAGGAQNSLWDSLELLCRAEGSTGPWHVLQIKGKLKLSICMFQFREKCSNLREGRWIFWEREGQPWGWQWEPGELGLAQVCFGSPLTELAK